MGVCEMTVKRTRLCYWIARPAKPGVQSSNTSRLRFTHPCVLAFITHMLCINGIEMTFVWLIRYTFALHIFPIRNLLHCVDESWWDMPFKETRLGDGVVDNAVATIVMLLPLWLHAESLWRHVFGIRIVTSHNAWMGYEYSLQNVSRPGRFTNIILAPRNNGACVITVRISPADSKGPF